MHLILNNDPQLCALCGNLSCLQAVDHSKITSEELQQLLNAHRVPSEQVAAIRDEALYFYEFLTSKILALLEADKKRVLKELNKLEYPFLQGKKVRLDLVAEVAEGCFEGLPSTGLIAVVNELRDKSLKSRRLIQDGNPVIETLNRLISESNATRIINAFEEVTPIQIFKLDCTSLQLMATPELTTTIETSKMLKRKVSIRCSEDTCQTQESDSLDLDIRNRSFPFISTKVFDMNNCGLTDVELVQPVRHLKNFPELKSVQLRQNRLSPLSCRVIGANLKNLQELDLRSNKIGDLGAIIIARHLGNLQRLFLCETGASDACVPAIRSNLSRLTFLWMENNQLTIDGCSEVIKHPSLKAIGLLGNKIAPGERVWLRQIFRNGYLSI